MTTPREHSRQQIDGFTRGLTTDELITLAEIYLRDIRYEWHETGHDTLSAALDDLDTITNQLRNRLTP